MAVGTTPSALVVVVGSWLIEQYLVPDGVRWQGLILRRPRMAWGYLNFCICVKVNLCLQGSYAHFCMSSS